MANKYFDKNPLIVYTGDIALAQDLNDVSNACEAGFDIVVQDFAALASDISNAISLSMDWASAAYSVEPDPIGSPGVYSSLHYATDSATSAAAAAADVLLTHADVVLTHADVVSTNADVLLTHADVVSTNADVLLTHADAASTAADVLTTNADVLLTHADVLLTNADVVSTAASASAAAASYDSFDDRYLGAKVVDPSLDNDGNALLTGAIYWNTSSNIMKVYNGSTWGPLSGTAVTGPGASIDNELPLFSGTSGTALKRSTATGLLKATSGVVSTAVSGTDIKTVNSTSLLGSGDVAVQPTLVSGTNIKTLNGASVLGSGDLVISTVGAGGFKNKIIGGDFTTNPWQRGTSFTAAASASYTADRFQVSHVSDAVVNIQKSATAPTADEAGVYTTHSIRAEVATADVSIGAAQYYTIRQHLEGLNVASFGFGQTGTRYITLSFWHKHTKVGTYCVTFENSAVDRHYIAEYTQAVTDAWEKATITIPVDTTGTWLYDTGIGLRINFMLACGSTYQGTAGAWEAGHLLATSNQVNALDSNTNNCYFALIQLEAGDIATTFENRSIGEELALCQRYYYRITPGNSLDIFNYGHCLSTTVLQVLTEFPVTMRTYPTALEQTGTAGDYTITYASSSSAATVAPTYVRATQCSAATSVTTGAVLTAGHAARLAATTAGKYLGWSAEL